MNYAIDIAPMAGMLLGANYWNSKMDEDFEDPTYHSVQICLVVFAIVITWQTPVE